mmetsp:Transcript_54458/g.145285  ORF Transcript_54458/g.145285 Transcript_54458/m.145285 type:complete len:224 (-) Transcript_54458:1460-2131(-)
MTPLVKRHYFDALQNSSLVRPAQENRFRLTQSLDLLCARRLRLVEIVQSEIATRVQVSVGADKLQYSNLCVLQLFLHLGKLHLRFCNLLIFVHNGFRFHADGSIRVLHKFFIRHLSVSHVFGSLDLHTFRVSFDLFEERHRACASRIFLVRLKPFWRRSTGFLLLCERVDPVENNDRFLKQSLGRLLISQRFLKCLVLCLGVRTSSFHLRLEFPNFGRQSVNL